MLRAIIIDDEQSGINNLKLHLDKFTADVKLVASTTQPAEGVGLIEDFRPEIVFLDINMPEMNGFELLSRLTYRGFHLIFTTAYHEFGLKAIKENALDYLLKPIDKQELIEAIARAKLREHEKKKFPDVTRLLADFRKELHGQRFPIHTRDGIEYTGLDEVIRLEADSNYTGIFLVTGTRHLVPKTLKEYEKILCEQEPRFMRIHQSHIINLRHVSRYYKENGGVVEMKDGAKLPLSKNKKEDFLRWLNI
jgi:two-component system LytT family response regulator